MNARIKMVGLVVALVSLYSAIALGAPAHKAKHAKKSDAPTVTYIDASGPVDDSALPTVTKKGPL